MAGFCPSIKGSAFTGIFAVQTSIRQASLNASFAAHALNFFNLGKCRLIKFGCQKESAMLITPQRSMGSGFDNSIIYEVIES